MSKFSIPADTKIGFVHLRIPNLERSVRFYADSLGLKVFSRQGATARLGAGNREFLVLTEHPGARQLPRSTGLYHFAILVPSRLELARVIQHFADIGSPLQGASDHLVSEALYLADPDDNGIEIYRDRPRSEWVQMDGGIQMATNPLDLDGIIRELRGQSEEWKGIHPDTRIGHIHLKVADIADSERFYCDVLGFDLMARYGPSASFVSAGGYHHHVGMNVWESLGASPPPPDSVGLERYSVALSDNKALDQIAQNFTSAGIAFERTPEGLVVEDPSKNRVLLTANSA